MQLVVLYGYQGADADPEQLAMTEQLFDAALGEFSVVAREQLCLLVGDFNVEPTKIPCLAKEISAGLWVDLEEAWALATGRQPASAWGSSGGHSRDFMVGCPLAAAAAVLSCTVQTDRWIAPHLAVGTLFGEGRWSCRVSQPVRRTPLWPASWLLLIRVGVYVCRGSEGFGRNMMIAYSSCLGRMLFFQMSLWMPVVVEGLSSQSVRPLWGLTGEARSRPKSPLRVAPSVQSDMTVIITSVQGGARKPQSGFLDGVGGGAGRAASCSSSTRLWTWLWLPWGRL